jgi:hypothetical protein
MYPDSNRFHSTLPSEMCIFLFPFLRLLSENPSKSEAVLCSDGELLAPHPVPELEDCSLSAVHDCLCSVFARTAPRPLKQ